MLKRLKIIIQLLILQLSAKGQTIPFEKIPYTNPLTNDVDSILHEQVKTFFKKAKTPGLIIGISREGEKKYYTYGYADSATKKSFGPQTIFEAGSITKTFTANLVVQFHQQKQLDIETPITRYLPVTGNDSVLNKLILSAILSHQSGLPRIPSNMDKIKGYNLMQPYVYTREHLYPYLQTLKNIRPGNYAYSNLGFGLLGTALENTTGRSFESLVSEYILQPIGMDNSYVNTRKGAADSATGYFYGKPAAYWLFDCMAGAGALKSTAEDMLKYLDVHHYRHINPQLDSAIRAVILPQKKISPRMQIGYAWHTLEDLKHRVFWHNGGTYGFSTFAAFEPISKTSIILASNSMGVNAALDKLAVDLLILLMGN
jgi:CubicO group peptidase (beta-lactamase class C family)